MAYDKGNFYTDSLGNHVIDNYNLENCQLNNCAVGESDFLFGNAIPTASVIGGAGSLYICTLAGSVGLYINTGTATAPVWEALALQA